MTTVGTERRTTFAAALRELSDTALEELFAARPDLTTPPPTSFLALAAAASARAGLDRALASLDALHLAVCECVVALDPVTDTVGADDVATALGDATDPTHRAAVRAAVDVLLRSALLWDAAPAGDPAQLRPSPGLADLFGPYPAGLGPVLPTGATAPAPNVNLPADSPPGAAQIVEALTWGPPVGVVPASASGRTAVHWLTDRGVLVRSDDRHVVLPRSVGLALRRGRTHRGIPTVAPEPDGRYLGTGVVDTEAALAGLEAVRLVGALLHEWAEGGPSPLRAGGLTVRDLRRLSAQLGVDDARTVLVVETAAAAGLVADDGEPDPAFGLTAAAPAWLGADTAERWVRLVGGWWASPRTPWLVGSRDARSAVRAALGPDLERGWVPRLRRLIFDVLADAPSGRSLERGGVAEVLRWRTPRAVPPAQAVDGLLDGAAFLGVTGAGALSSAGRVLATSTSGPAVDAATRRQIARAAFTDMLPPEVNELLLQGDLTGIVPGRPGGELSELVEIAAVVESRGSAMALRFTPESVARALEQVTADELLGGLMRFSRVGVPQPLEYLVRDTARRRGNLRVGAASAYLRSDDAALLAGLASRPDLQALRLEAIAPTVLVSMAPAAEVHAVLRAAGVGALVEGPGGTIVRVDATWRQAPASAGRFTNTTAAGAPRGITARGMWGTEVGGTEDGAPRGDEARTRRRRIVTRLRASESGAAAVGADAGEAGSDAHPAAPVTPPTGPDSRIDIEATVTDPPSAIGLLREAIADQSLVWIEMVGGDGSVVRRRLRPLTLDSGRLRALDLEREAEVTVAVHRVASVRPDG